MSDSASRDLMLASTLADFTLDHIEVAAYLAEPDGGLCYVNAAACKALGYEKAELLALHVADVDADFALANWPDVYAQIKTAGALVFTSRHRRKDGSVFSVELNVVHCAPAGQSYVLGLAVDISARLAAEAALKASELRFRRLFDDADSLSIQGYRPDGSVAYWNRASEVIYGYTAIEALGGNLLDLIIPAEMHDGVRGAIAWMFENNQGIPAGKLMLKHKAGHLVPVWSSHTIVKIEGQESLLFCMDVDLSEHERTEAALRESERRLSYVLDATGEGLWDWDLATNNVKHNRRWCELFGFDETMLEHPGASFESLLHEADRDAVLSAIQACLDGQGSYESRHRMRRCDGRIVWVHDRGNVVERDAEGKALRMVGSHADISEQHLAQAQIEYLALHDALTQLPNRNLARERFQRAASNAARTGTKVAILFLDLDRFKDVNDTLGHHVGDLLLQEVAVRLQTLLRDTDIVSRQGGDEFLVALTNLPKAELAAQVAQNILVALTTPFSIGDQNLYTSFSIGISMLPDDGKDFDTLLQKADTAMYAAKAGGRNAYHFFTQTMNDQAAERLQILNLLRGALTAGQFALHYQPQMNLDDGRVLGAEALLRWNSPELGMVSPARFIPVAEDSGLIVSIGDWVLQEACRQGRLWQDQLGQPLNMSVNLSAVQFQHGDVAQSVRTAIEASGFDPRFLEIELTESVLVKNPESVVRTLKEIADMGISLAIDDFGTGYSSLSYLRMLPVRRLKIDQSFVRDMLNNQDAASIVRTIVQMAESLRLNVIAEGVEQPEQVEWLRHSGCSEAQGFWFARPMAAADFEAFVAHAHAPH